jgi:hypothetical protein
VKKKKKGLRYKLKLFITGFLQVMFVTINTYLVSREYYAGVFAVGFMINIIWTFNVKKIAFGGVGDRVSYSTGAALGTLFGLFISVKLYEFLK